MAFLKATAWQVSEEQPGSSSWAGLLCSASTRHPLSVRAELFAVTESRRPGCFSSQSSATQSGQRQGIEVMLPAGRGLCAGLSSAWVSEASLFWLRDGGAGTGACASVGGRGRQGARMAGEGRIP